MAERFITTDTFKRQGQTSLNLSPRQITAGVLTPISVILSDGVDGVAWSGTVTLYTSASELRTSSTVVATYTAGGVKADTSPILGNVYWLEMTALTSGEVQFDLFNAYNGDVLSSIPSNPLNGALIRRSASPAGLMAVGGALVNGAPADVPTSRNATTADVGVILNSSGASAATITVPNDATSGWTGSAVLILFQYGTGSAAFAAGSGVTFRNTAPTPARYLKTTLLRIAANEWAYV